MVSALEIESTLIEDGFDIDGVVLWHQKSVYYCDNYLSDDLPSVKGIDPIDPPINPE